MNIRLVQPSDIPALVAIFVQPRVTVYWGSGETLSAEAARTMIEGYLIRSPHNWVIEDAGRVVGLGHIIRSNRFGTYLLSYAIDPAVQGRGLATAFCRFAIQWFFNQALDDKLDALIHPDNTASRRVAEKCGMQRIAQQVDNGKDLFRIERNE